MCCSPFCREQESAWHAKSNERRSLVSVVWQLLYTITSSSESTLNDLELIAVNLLEPLTKIQCSLDRQKMIHRPHFPPLSLSRCPSPILHERAGDIQGGEGEIHREREPTLERTRSAGESDG